MSYYFAKSKSGVSFEKAIEQISESLKEEGFGILTEINIKDTFKKKLGVDFKKYTILGACNPNFAIQAISAEDKIGVFLPCNVVVSEGMEGSIDITVVDPVASMVSVENKELESLASEVREKIKRALDRA